MLKCSKYIMISLLSIAMVFALAIKIVTSVWDIVLLFLYLVSTTFILFFDFSKIETTKYEKIKEINFYIFPLLLSLFIWQEYTCAFFFVNYAFTLAIHILLSYLLKNTKIASVIECIFSYAIYIINEYVYVVRGIPIMPNDLFALSTASAVSSQYSFAISSQMVIGTFGLILLFVFIFKLLNREVNKTQTFNNLYISAACLIILFVSTCIINFSSSEYFAVRDAHKLYGFAFSSILFSENLTLEEPEEYSSDIVDEVFSQYEDDELSNTDLPNIIVIMNESFSDLSCLGELKTNEDYMQYFNSLKEEATYGNLIVPVNGGGTCNSEFEFLTGCSTSYLPKGTYAYMQYIKDELKESLPWYFKNLGFNTYAVHPFWEFAWNRNKIYSELGFDDFISLEDMSNLDTDVFHDDLYLSHYASNDLELVRTLVSDRENYNQIIKLYENDQKPKFIFSITMQNHGSYEYAEEDFQNTVVAEDLNDDELNQYLTLVKESNIALEEFINYFRDKDEKTIILFFGDHQPVMEDKTIEKIMGTQSVDDLTLEDMQKRYTTPFLIWKNYDLTSNEVDLISINYLSLLLKEEADLPLTKWDKIRKNAMLIYKAINPLGALDANNVWNKLEEVELPKEYELIQYKILFDN